MFVVWGDGRFAPARLDIARVKEERARGGILPAAVAGDLCDRNGLVPQRRVAHRGHPAAAHEAELALLKHDAAQALREAARLRAVDHDMRDRELAGKRLAARFEIDRAGEAAQFGIDLGGPRSEEHTSELQSLMRSSDAVFCLK